jgi:hypothetical protein
MRPIRIPPVSVASFATTPLFGRHGVTPRGRVSSHVKVRAAPRSQSTEIVRLRPEETLDFVKAARRKGLLNIR